MLSDADVSIVIVNWNAKNVLRDCIESIYRTTRGLSFEVIIVDNASSDGSVEMLIGEFPRVCLVQNTENRGFAAANNQGMAIAKGRFLLLLNPDTKVNEYSISGALEYAEEHVEIGILGCRSIGIDGRQQSTLFRYPGMLDVVTNVFFPKFIMRRIPVLGRSRYVGYNLDLIHDVDVVAGCFMFARREVYEGVGGMDEVFFMYGEEVDWCYRTKRAGWTIRYVPHISIVHYGGVSAAQCADDMSLAMARSQLLLLQKIHGTGIAYIANLLMLSRDCVRGSIYLSMKVIPGLNRFASHNQIRIATQRIPLYLTGMRKVDWTQ